MRQREKEIERYIIIESDRLRNRERKKRYIEREQYIESDADRKIKRERNNLEYCILEGGSFEEHHLYIPLP